MSCKAAAYFSGPAFLCDTFQFRRETFVLRQYHHAYLTKTRCLDREVISVFARAKMLYEDAKYHNAVFVGFDKDGVACHVHKRGTYTQGEPFKGNVDGCDPRYSFHYTGQSDTVYVFETPIHMLSFISMYQKDWQRHSYVSLCGVAEHVVLHLLSENP
ncbi:MAG: DUF3991 domain-containing protein [Oscillospiraceae bacterium]|nr:DUF3991 domain-containing protein [Oscillospiraceae bacterium]